MMPDLESSAYLRYYVIVQVETIIGYDSLWKSISAYNFSLDETGTTDFVTLAYNATSTHLVK